MSALFPLITFVLFYVGVLLLLRRSLTQILFGVVLLSHAVNLLVFSARVPKENALPILNPNEPPNPAALSDPLSQALVLTAIVISFGVFAFFITLFLRARDSFGSDDTALMRDEHDY